MPESRFLRRRGTPKWLWAIVVGALPWTWFLVRGLTGYADAVAVALPFIVEAGFALLALGALAFRRWEPLVVVASIAVFGVVTVVAPRMPQPSPAPQRPVAIASANTFVDNANPDGAARSLVATGADVLVVVEASADVQRALADEDRSHPFTATSGEQVVRSRFPVQELPLPVALPASWVLVVRVQGPGGPFDVFAVHAPNPLYESSFPDELSFFRRLRAAALASPDPAVIAGDLNLSDRTTAYRELDGAFRDALRTGPGLAPNTFDAGIWKALFLRIDHIFVSRAWCAGAPARYAIPGSDHEAVAASVGPCPDRWP